MAGPVSLELDPIFLKGLSYLHSKSKDSADKLKALLDDSLARGSETSYRSLQKVRPSFKKKKKGFVYVVHFYCFNVYLNVFVCFCLSLGYRGFQTNKAELEQAGL